MAASFKGPEPYAYCICRQGTPQPIQRIGATEVGCLHAKGKWGPGTGHMAWREDVSCLSPDFGFGLTAGLVSKSWIEVLRHGRADTGIGNYVFWAPFGSVWSSCGKYRVGKCPCEVNATDVLCPGKTMPQLLEY